MARSGKGEFCEALLAGSLSALGAHCGLHRGTPELQVGTSGGAKGNGEEGESSPTVCTNCQTTNTPLWRRDPEGQPLCA